MSSLRSVRSGSQSPSSVSFGDVVTLPFPHLSGAVDIVCVRQKDGSLTSSPFYVRFGKYQGLLKRREKEVYITVNGVTMPWSMRLGRTGVAYFAPGSSTTNELVTITRKHSQELIRRQSEDSEPEALERAEEAAAVDLPAARSNTATSGIGSSLGSVDGYSSPEDGAMSPIGRLSLDESQEALSYSLNRGLSLDSQNGLELLQKHALEAKGPFSHNRNATLDAYEGVDLDKANSLEMRVRNMAEDCSLQEIVSDADVEEVRAGLAEARGKAPAALGRSVELEEEGAIRESSAVAGGALLDSTLDSIPTSWSSDFAAEARNLIKIVGLKAFKSMEVSACGEELSNCIIDNDGSSSLGAMAGNMPIGESGEMEMTSAEVSKVFNANVVAMAEMRERLRGGAAGANLVCRVGNVLMRWEDVSNITMTYLAFQEYPEDCPKHVISLQPSAPVNLTWKVVERTKRQEEKWRFFSWLSSSFRTPDKPPEALQPAGAEGAGANGEEAAVPSPAGEDEADSKGKSPAAAERSPGGGADPENDSPSTIFTPSAGQLDMLNLKDGQNTVTFSCYSSLWGTQTATAFIYLMPWNSKVVVSDVDGTITKSDMLGHVMTLIGRDWSHTGVTDLMKNIRKNGYHVMYLSARSIGQATSTRDFLFNLDQNGAKLPVGPVIISPDGILPSLFREMIVKRPDEFKIACLQTIKDLFPEDWNPFYAGFGNRPTDEVSYSAVSVPDSRIFTINPKGEVALSSASQVKTSQWCTLQGINELVDEFFPQWRENEEDHVDKDKYSGYNFWKVPQHEIVVDGSDDEA